MQSGLGQDYEAYYIGQGFDWENFRDFSMSITNCFGEFAGMINISFAAYQANRLKSD